MTIDVATFPFVADLAAKFSELVKGTTSKARARRQCLIRVSVGVTGVLLLTAILSFVWGVTEGPHKAGAIFGGIQVVLGFLALLAGVAALGTAIVALVVSIGPYLEWRKERFGRADLEMLVGAGRGSEVGRRLSPINTEYEATELDVLLSVSLSNKSDFNVRMAMLNVVVASTCQIQHYPVGDRDKRIRIAAVLSTNSELLLGKTLEVRYLTAGLELMTPANWYTFAMQVNLPGPGRWPVLISVSTPNGPLSRVCHLSFRDPSDKSLPEPRVVVLDEIAVPAVVSNTN